MSECVVRMEMPSNCWVCPFGLDGYIWDENDARTHYVRFCSRHSGEEFHVLEIDTIDRPWYCDSFICSLPEGHGRLADKDEMLKKIENYHRYMTIGRESDPRCIIEDSPTIVPAEAERSEHEQPD